MKILTSLSLLLSLAITPAWASVVWQGHCRDRAPLIWVTPTGCSGPGIEVINIAIERLGHRVEWNPVPWARTLAFARSGEVDLIPLHSMDAEREAFLDPILIGYAARTLHFFKNADNPLQISQADQLSNLSIGALNSSFYSETFNLSMASLNMVFVTQTEQLVQMLQAGYIDLVVTSEQHGLETYEQSAGLVAVAYQEVTMNGRYFSVPLDSAHHQYVPALRAEIEKMRASGEITEIFTRFGVAAPVSDL